MVKNIEYSLKSWQKKLTKKLADIERCEYTTYFHTLNY
jgi:hypothetical protein